jgi:hypothetical protein
MTFQSYSLTTLVYYHPYKPFSLPTDPIGLPSLRNLRLLSTPEAFRQNLGGIVPFLELYGQNLWSLQLGGYGRVHRVLPKEVWELCPQLRRLDSIFVLRHPPPVAHPLRTISVFHPDGEYLQGLTQDIQLWPFYDTFFASSSIKCIVFQFQWDWVTNIDDQTYDWLWKFSEFCQEKGIWLMDRDGVSFQNSEAKPFVPAPPESR